MRLITYIYMLEKVQKKILGHLAYSNNHTMLRGRFNIKHLVLRRRVADICIIYKLLNGSLEPQAFESGGI